MSSFLGWQLYRSTLYQDGFVINLNYQSWYAFKQRNQTNHLVKSNVYHYFTNEKRNSVTRDSFTKVDKERNHTELCDAELVEYYPSVDTRFGSMPWSTASESTV